VKKLIGRGVNWKDEWKEDEGLVVGELDRRMVAEEWSMGEGAVVKWQSWQAEGLSKTLCHTSRGIQREVVKKSDSGSRSITGKNDLTRCVTHREAVFGTVIHSAFDACNYEILWTYAVTRLL